MLLEDLPDNFRTSFPNAFPGAATAAAHSEMTDEGGTTGALDNGSVAIEVGGRQAVIRSGSVAIAAITSCTNTSNPTVMVGAGLLARNAVARGLTVGPSVKTSLAPGSKAVTGYLETAGLMAPLADLGFALAGYGCTTCIGNSGPLEDAVAEAIEEHDLVVAAVLSGNRNFEGRIHPQARASYLASPPLVVAFALAGRVDIDLTTEPLGIDRDGRAVMLADLWPSPDEIKRVIGTAIDPALFQRTYATVFDGRRPLARAADPGRRPVRSGRTPRRTSRSHPSSRGCPPAQPSSSTSTAPASWPSSATRSRPTTSARPGRSRPRRRPAGGSRSTASGPLDFNSYGARRGHHEVMMRGTFANIRLRNALDGRPGGPVARSTCPTATRAFIYDVAMQLPGRGRAAARHRGQGVRLGLVARLGGQGPDAPRRAGRHRRERSSGSTGRTWSGWASCRSSSCPARAPRRSA